MTTLKGYADAGSQRRPRRRIMRAFKINEISAVDNPAQEGARALILKRAGHVDASQTDDDATTVSKRALLTTSDEGHSHLAIVDHGSGELTNGETSYVDGHSHPWIVREDGNIVIGEVRGHTHAVAELGKVSDLTSKVGKAKGDKDAGESGETVNKEDPMADNDKTPTAEQVAELTKRAERAEKIAGLPADVRKYFDGIEGKEAQDAFLAKSADAQKSEAEAAETAKADSNPVVYKSEDGTEYRKNDDPRLVKMAKQADEDRKARVEAEKIAKDSDLRKRAEDLRHIPGTVEDRVEMLRAIDSIPNEEARKRSLDALKAQDAGLAKAFETAGHRDASLAEGSVESELDALAKAHAKEHDVSFEAAYDAVLKTEKGQELYAKTISN